MAKAIIHIGMDKTGSTYIQHVCAQLRPELAALGICYPLPRGSVFINHVLFAMAHGFAPHIPSTDAQSAAAWDTMAHTLPDVRQTLLISSEHFSHDRSDTTIRRLKTWLGTHGYHDVRIVVFLRNQVSWLVSAYGQDIKGGNIKTIDDFYRKRSRWMIYSNRPRAAAARLCRSAAAFGTRRYRHGAPSPYAARHAAAHCPLEDRQGGRRPAIGASRPCAVISGAESSARKPRQASLASRITGSPAR